MINKEQSLDTDDIIGVDDKTLKMIRASNSMSAHANPNRRWLMGNV